METERTNKLSPAALERKRERQRRYNATSKGKETRRRYEESAKGKETRRRYRESERGREVHRDAQCRYSITAKGILTQIRARTGTRAARLEELKSELWAIAGMARGREHP